MHNDEDKPLLLSLSLDVIVSHCLLNKTIYFAQEEGLTVAQSFQTFSLLAITLAASTSLW